MVGTVTGPRERQRNKPHAGGIQVFIPAALGIDAIKAADDTPIDHVDDRFRITGLDRLDRRNALLQDHFLDRPPLFPHRHLIAGPSIQVKHVRGVANAHHPHPVGPRIRFDNHKGLLLNPVLTVLGAHLGQ